MGLSRLVFIFSVSGSFIFIVSSLKLYHYRRNCQLFPWSSYEVCYMVSEGIIESITNDRTSLIYLIISRVFPTQSPSSSLLVSNHSYDKHPLYVALRSFRLGVRGIFNRGQKANGKLPSLIVCCHVRNLGQMSMFEGIFTSYFLYFKPMSP